MSRIYFALAAGSIAAFVPMASVAAQCVAGASPNFDFVTAPRVLFETDFTRDQIGDFPEGIEYKNGAMEVSEWQGLRGLKASSPSALAIALPEALPERFTVELGVVHRNTKQVGAWTIKIYGGRAALPDGALAATRVNIGHDSWQIVGGGASADGEMAPGGSEDCIGQEMQVRMTVDGSKLKVYADGRRLASIPNAQFLRARGLVLALEGRDDGNNAVYVTSIRVAGSGAGERMAMGPRPIARERSAGLEAAPDVGAVATAPVAARVGQAPPARSATLSTQPSAAQDGSVGMMDRPAAGTVGASRADGTPTEVAMTAHRNERLATNALPARNAAAMSAQAADPTAVHATGFIAFAGYNMNVLRWKPAPGALGYRLARSSWDPIKLAFIPGSDTELPSEPVSDAGGLIRDTTFTDHAVTAGTQYVYWLTANYKSADGYFYFPTSVSPPMVTSNPRSSVGKPWVPSDWQSPVTMASASIEISDEIDYDIKTGYGPPVFRPYVHLVWQTKAGAHGYEVWRMAQSKSHRSYDSWYDGGEITDCGRTFELQFALKWIGGGEPAYQGGPRRVGGPLLIEPRMSWPVATVDYGDEEYRNSVYCLVIKAVYPDALHSGSPTVLHGLFSDPVVVRMRRTESGWELSPLQEGLTFTIPAHGWFGGGSSGECRVGRAQGNVSPCARIP